jgi:hypothetical protein
MGDSISRLSGFDPHVFSEEILNKYADKTLIIEFTDGEIFTLRNVHDCSDAADKEGTWNGAIVDFQRLSEKRQKRFKIGEFLDFQIRDIKKITAIP